MNMHLFEIYGIDLTLMNMNYICECFALDMITCLFDPNMSRFLSWI